MSCFHASQQRIHLSDRVLCPLSPWLCCAWPCWVTGLKLLAWATQVPLAPGGMDQWEARSRGRTARGPSSPGSSLELPRVAVSFRDQPLPGPVLSPRSRWVLATFPTPDPILCSLAPGVDSFLKSSFRCPGIPCGCLPTLSSGAWGATLSHASAPCPGG